MSLHRAMFAGTFVAPIMSGFPAQVRIGKPFAYGQYGVIVAATDNVTGRSLCIKMATEEQSPGIQAEFERAKAMGLADIGPAVHATGTGVFEGSIPIHWMLMDRMERTMAMFIKELETTVKALRLRAIAMAPATSHLVDHTPANVLVGGPMPVIMLCDF